MMKSIVRLSVPVLAALVLLVCACQKYVDKQTNGDPRLTNPYCNDPLAVNYNWGFPGKADNTICFFPNDLFVGKYLYFDTIKQTDLTASYSRIDTLYISSVSHTALRVVGFCLPGDTLKLTAVSYVANLDTTIGTGQPLCRIQDTVSGTITKNLADTGNILHVFFQVVSDTGTTLHIGLAKKL